MNNKPKLPRVIYVLLAMLILLCVSITMCTGNGNSKGAGSAGSSTESGLSSHLYDNTEVIGTIAVTHMNQADCTEEALEDYYFNFYLKNMFLKKHILVFDDTDPLRGVDFIGGTVAYNVLLEKNKDDTYTDISDSSDKENVTSYHEEDGHLVK